MITVTITIIGYPPKIDNETLLTEIVRSKLETEVDVNFTYPQPNVLLEKAEVTIHISPIIEIVRVDSLMRFLRDLPLINSNLLKIEME